VGVDEHRLDGGVAVRVSALCLGSRGRPSPLLICSAAVRAALLLDLALAGRITETEDAVEVDATPTGFAPADRLLAAVVAEPDRSLDSWLDERRLTLDDVIAANVSSGRWDRRDLAFRRDLYVDLAAEQTRRDLARSADDPLDGLSRADACVTAIGASSGLLDRKRGVPGDVPPALLTATRDVERLAEHVTAHLTATYWLYRGQAGALRTGDTIGPG
jgi:hypothetical protein